MSSADPGAAIGAAVLDDQLALLAALGSLPMKLGVVPVTTYTWQQRILGAFVAPRATAGQLQQIAAKVGANAARAHRRGRRSRPGLPRDR